MGYKKYFTRKRAKFKSLDGEIVNIPYSTIIRSDIGGLLFYQEKKLCHLSSQNAIDFFVQDDDGNGKKRAQIVNDITKILEKNDSRHQIRWNRIWSDSICQSYRRKELKDHWLWDRSFYDAPIFILEHIKGLVTKED